MNYIFSDGGVILNFSFFVVHRHMNYTLLFVCVRIIYFLSYYLLFVCVYYLLFVCAYYLLFVCVSIIYFLSV